MLEESDYNALELDKVFNMTHGDRHIISLNDFKTSKILTRIQLVGENPTIILSKHQEHFQKLVDLIIDLYEGVSNHRVSDTVILKVYSSKPIPTRLVISRVQFFLVLI